MQRHHTAPQFMLGEQSRNILSILTKITIQSQAKPHYAIPKRLCGRGLSPQFRKTSCIDGCFSLSISASKNYQLLQLLKTTILVHISKIRALASSQQFIVEPPCKTPCSSPLATYKHYIFTFGSMKRITPLVPFSQSNRKTRIHKKQYCQRSEQQYLSPNRVSLANVQRTHQISQALKRTATAANNLTGKLIYYKMLIYQIYLVHLFYIFKSWKINRPDFRKGYIKRFNILYKRHRLFTKRSHLIIVCFFEFRYYAHCFEGHIHPRNTHNCNGKQRPTPQKSMVIIIKTFLGQLSKKPTPTLLFAQYQA